jgi:tryptophan synthase alpha chain
MNRIDKLFQTKKSNLLSIYFTAGHPNLNDTCTIIKAIEKSGADLIEIGIPFSDPIADGPVIQQSNQVALKNGMSLKLLFEQLKDIRKEVAIPLIFMGSFNPVFKFGVDQFCAKCKETGIDGTIIPDLPAYEYEEKYMDVFKKNDLFNIFLVTPQTEESRIKHLDKLSKGFLYMVSSYATTGSGKGMYQSQAYFERMQKMELKNPRLIGFGIKDKTSFQNACKYANGAIIGTAFIKALEMEGAIEERVKTFIKEIL